MASKTKKATKKFCKALRELHDVNVEIASDGNASNKDRKDGAENAEKARQDGLSWGCGWAERA